MVEILYNQYHTKPKLYVTWDAVAWHNSGLLLEALDQFNEETRACSVGPIIELVPLPTSSQFLNMVEGVLSGMTRAVINNSDYPNAAQMKQAVSKHFSERNEHFRHNPRRVGKKICSRFRCTSSRELQGFVGITRATLHCVTILNSALGWQT